MDLTNRVMAAKGYLVNDNEINIFCLKKTFKIKDLNKNQITFSNEVVFIGKFIDNETIDITDIDDLPTIDNTSVLGKNFFSIIHDEDTYAVALITDMCSFIEDDDNLIIKSNTSEGSISGVIQKPKVSDINDWFYGADKIIVLTSKNAQADMENKVLTLNECKYLF